MKDRLAGRFSILKKTDEPSIIIGLMGNVSAGYLSCQEIRKIAAFYVDGKFLINGVNQIRDSEKLSGLRLPRNNFNSLIRITYSKLPACTPLDEYQRALTEEADTGIEI